MTEFTTPMPTAKESVIRLRTIKQCLAYIKELDADTAVTEHFIRTLCRSGKVLYYASGSKSLVSLAVCLPISMYKARTSRRREANTSMKEKGNEISF